MLWLSSAYFLPLFDAACLFTIFWCAFRATLDDTLQAKIINWQIMFFALLLELLRFHGFVWDWHISDLLLANYVFFSGIYLLYYHSGRKKNISEIMGLKYESLDGICSALIMISAAILPQINILEMVYNNRNRYYIWAYAVLFMLSFCGVLHQILFSGSIKKIGLNKVKKRPLHPLFLIFISIICSLLWVQLNWESLVFWAMCGVFVALTLSGISAFFSRFYMQQTMQKTDLFKSFYDNVFMGILQNSGRLLWLVIDWKLAEKFITGTVLALWQTGLHFFKNIQNDLIFRFLFILLVLAIIIWFSPYSEGVFR